MYVDLIMYSLIEVLKWGGGGGACFSLPLRLHLLPTCDCTHSKGYTLRCWGEIGGS